MPCHQRPTTSGSCSTAVTCARGSSSRLRNDQSLSRPSTVKTMRSPSVVTSTIGTPSVSVHFAHCYFVGTRAFSSSNQGRTTVLAPASFIGFRELMSACGHTLLQLFTPVQQNRE